jgi:hypothetical protein
MSPVADELDRNVKARELVHQLLQGVECDLADKKIYLLTAYVDITREHHAAIDSLIAQEHFGSAFSLLRSIAETLYRAAWVCACATKAQLEEIVNDDSFEFPKDMMKAVDQAFGSDDFFQNIKRLSWKSMCSYAHSGLLQIQRRHGSADGFIGPNYSDEEIIEVLKGSTVFLSLLVILFLRVTGFKEKAEILKQFALRTTG